MSGIIGILGKSDVQDRIVDGLSRLDYRGYDSAGVAIMSDARVSVSKVFGKLENLKRELVRTPLVGRVGIGHTRWATHGAANTVNAHRHRAEHVAVPPFCGSSNDFILCGSCKRHRCGSAQEFGEVGYS